MKRFKSILLVLAGPECDRAILERATDLARRNAASLTLFDVVGRSSQRPSAGSDELEADVAAGQARLEELRELGASVAVPRLECAVASGTPHIEVMKRVEIAGHDLVIAAPDARRARRTIARRPTTATQLLRQCPVPVWIETSAMGAPVAVAVGPQRESDQDNSLNVTLVELASSMAQLRGEALNIVHAWRVERESLLHSRHLSMSRSDINEVVAEARQKAQDHIDALLASVASISVPYEVHVLKGEATSVIPAFVEDVNPSVVVMGVTPRKKLERVVAGSTAERILGLVNTSVLAVKPEGYISSVAV